MVFEADAPRQSGIHIIYNKGYVRRLSFHERPLQFTFEAQDDGFYVQSVQYEGLEKYVLGYRIGAINGVDVLPEESAEDLYERLNVLPLPLEIDFFKRNKFEKDAFQVLDVPEDRLNPPREDETRTVIEFNSKPFGFTFVDEDGGVDGYAGRVWQMSNAYLAEVLEVNSYVYTINGDRVMSFDTDVLYTQLRKSPLPCVVEFRKQKRQTNKYYTCFEDGEVELLSEKEGSVMIGPHKRNLADSVFIEFQSSPFGFKIGPHHEEGTGKAAKPMGATIIGHDNENLKEILPKGSYLVSYMKRDSEKRTSLPVDVPFCSFKDVTDDLQRLTAPVTLGFLVPISSYNGPLIVKEGDKKLDIVFRERPFGLVISDIHGGLNGCGGRVADFNCEHAKAIIPRWAKIAYVNGARVKEMNHDLLQSMLETLPVECVIGFELDGWEPHSDDEGEIDIEKENDGVLVHFIQQPFGHITATSLGKEQFDRLEKFEIHLEKEKWFHPEAFKVVPDTNIGAGTVLFFQHKPFGFRFRPNEHGYDGIVDKVENPALTEIISEGSHLICLNGKDVRNLNFDILEKYLDMAPLPTTMQFVRHLDDLIPEEVIDNTPRIEKVAGFTDISNNTGRKLRFHKQIETKDEEGKVIAKKFGFTVLDAFGGYNGFGAYVTSLESDDLDEFLPTHSRLIEIGGEDVKHMNFGVIKKKLEKAEAPCDMTFISPHTEIIKTFSWNRGESSYIEADRVEILTFSNLTAFNVKFDSKPIGLIFKDDFGGMDGTGAIITGHQDPDLKAIIPLGSRIVSCGHKSFDHNCSVLDIHEEIEKLEPPIFVGFTYEPENGGFPDNYANLLKQEKGKIEVEFLQKPIGLQLAPRSDGRGVTVSGYDNLALRALVPPESNLIQIGDDHVENDSQESIQQLFDASDLPMLCVFEMNPNFNPEDEDEEEILMDKDELHLPEDKMNDIEEADDEDIEEVDNEENETEKDPVRAAWTIGSSVEIYSSTLGEWCRGHVNDIVYEDDEELLRVRYFSDPNDLTKCRLKDCARSEYDVVRPVATKKEIQNSIVHTRTTTEDLEKQLEDMESANPLDDIQIDEIFLERNESGI